MNTYFLVSADISINTMHRVGWERDGVGVGDGGKVEHSVHV